MKPSSLSLVILVAALVGCDSPVAGNTQPNATATAAPGAYAYVRTLAGYGQAGFANLQGSSAGFTNPGGLARLPDGSLVVVDQGNQCLRKLTAVGDVSTYAGAQESGFKNDLLQLARFNSPSEIAAEASGTLYVADTSNHAVRKLVGDHVTTLAGTGVAGYLDAAGDRAQFRSPRGVCVDAQGTVYVADCLNHRIRMISPAGEVTTVAGTGTAGFTDGDAANAQFNQPGSLAVDQAGNVYVADRLNQRIRKLSPAGQVSTLAGDGTAGFADGAGIGARFNGINGLAVATDGTLYVADGENQRIRRVAPDGTVTTVAGNGTYGVSAGNGYTPQVATSVAMRRPAGVALGPDGKVYFTDQLTHLIRVLY